jgi:NAD dependent epimerase/dehydratase family enzyme
MSWIALDDVVGVIGQALSNNSLAGPVNVVAPEAVTNREFARTLGRVLKRPAVLPLPAFAVRLLFGEMGNELLLASAKVLPSRLVACSYRFRYPILEGALGRVLQ